MLPEQIWAQGIKTESQNQEFTINWISASCLSLQIACSRVAEVSLRIQGSLVLLSKNSAHSGSAAIELWKICFCFTDVLHESVSGIPQAVNKIRNILFSYLTVFRRKLLVLYCMFSGLLYWAGHRAVAVPFICFIQVHPWIKKPVTENRDRTVQNKNHSWKENYSFHEYWSHCCLQWLKSCDKVQFTNILFLMEI